jgi:hypothetical protein
MNPCGAGLLGCLVAWPMTCWAQATDRAGDWLGTVDDAQPLAWLARSPGTSRLLAEHERFLAYLDAQEHPELRNSASGVASNLEFKDHLDYVRRVRALRALSLVHLWDSHNMSLFLGVDRRGVYGLHLRREDPHEGAVR